MEYVYTLNEKAKMKYGFDTMIVNGWFGYYSKFNLYYSGNNKVDLGLRDSDIDYIIKHSTCIER